MTYEEGTMRLLLLFEPGFALALAAMVTRYAHEPTTRIAFGIGLVATLALLPLGLLLRATPAPAEDGQPAEDA